MLTPESVESPTAEKQMIGSMMVFEAEKLEDVKKMVEEDIYYTSGVVSPSVLCFSDLGLTSASVGRRKDCHSPVPTRHLALRRKYGSCMVPQTVENEYQCVQ
jgi:hypothetical protein